MHAVREGLIGRGHAVQVISFRRLYLKPFFPGRTEYDASHLKLEAGAEPILVPLNPLSWLKAERAVKRFSPDAVVIQWWNPFFGAALGWLARAFTRKGFRCIYECHNVIPHEHARLLRPLLHFGLAPVSRFIVHSESDRNILLGIRAGADVRVAKLPSVDLFRGSKSGDRTGRSGATRGSRYF
jgi:hypothetical protein